MHTTTIIGTKGKEYKMYDYTVKDTELRWADRYVDAMNLARFVGCFGRKDSEFIMRHMERVVGIISENVADYAKEFGFNYLVYCAMRSGCVYDDYVPYDWSGGLRGYIQHISYMYDGDAIEGYHNIVRAMDGFGATADL